MDVGRNSFGVMRVRRSFAWAYDRLTINFPDETVRSSRPWLNRILIIIQSTTLLGRLVSVRGEPFRIRLPNLESATVLPLPEESTEHNLLLCPNADSNTSLQKQKRKSKKKQKKSLKKKQANDAAEGRSKQSKVSRSISPKRQRKIQGDSK